MSLRAYGADSLQVGSIFISLSEPFQDLAAALNKKAMKTERIQEAASSWYVPNYLSGGKRYLPDPKTTTFYMIKDKCPTVQIGDVCVHGGVAIQNAVVVGVVSTDVFSTLQDQGDDFKLYEVLTWLEPTSCSLERDQFASLHSTDKVIYLGCGPKALVIHRQIETELANPIALITTYAHLVGKCNVVQFN